MASPSETLRRFSVRKTPPPHRGLDAWVHGWAGAWRRRGTTVERLRERAGRVEEHAGAAGNLTNHDLRARLLEHRNHFRRGGRFRAEAMVPALAALREAAHRVLGLRAFPEQLMGAMAMDEGNLAEMATGEGKTLAAGIAAILRAWMGRPCHVITVNDYLVERDERWLGPLFGFCHLTHGHVVAPMPPDDRRLAYDRDITYGTSKEITADFLRDRIKPTPDASAGGHLARSILHGGRRGHDPVQRGLHSAIIDEADSILIDEAVTPLILSAPRPNAALREVVELAQRIAAPLAADADYRVDKKHREVELTPAGEARLLAVAADLPPLWRGLQRSSELVRHALMAREFYLPGRQYVVVDGKIVIVDEFTGRQMPQRTWRQGVHQAIEAKEGLPITDPTDTLARISFQRFFRLYAHLSGMTGTAMEAAAELWQVYSLPVVRIPLHRPCLREESPDQVLPTAHDRWLAVVREIQRVHHQGRPVLVGTRSVEASETLASHLAGSGVPFQILNAVRHQEEARVVAMAGEPGRVTIATNMAGRGTDIRLGDGVAARGGLHVIATERHESRRVDRQLFGRSARQGDPGSAVAILSTEDDLFQRHLPALARRSLLDAAARGLPGSGQLVSAATSLAQRNAQAKARRMRASVLRTDEWLDEALSFANPPTIAP